MNPVRTLLRRPAPAAALAAVAILVLSGLPALQPGPQLYEPAEKGGPRAGFPDEFIRYHNWIRAEERGGQSAYAVGYRYDELDRARSRRAVAKRSMPAMIWTERGPANVGGRTRALLVDAGDASGATWFAGSAGGGVWKTTNRGISWTHVTEGLPNLAFSSLAQSASDPDVLYAGSGEGFFNGDALQGAGVFKSTDHGQTWFRLSSTNRYDFRYVNRLVANPGNPDEVVA
ncbi:MAG: hypothetical protein HKN17_00935, partial [Rhodothermales bacterium]|nr:hypothetical protein [Rhodothermales bacterium]